MLYPKNKILLEYSERLHGRNFSDTRDEISAIPGMKFQSGLSLLQANRLNVHNQKPALTDGPSIVSPNWQEKAESVPVQSFLQCCVKALFSYFLIGM